jgi:hypothetical protein
LLDWLATDPAFKATVEKVRNFAGDACPLQIGGVDGLQGALNGLSPCPPAGPVLIHKGGSGTS